MQAKGFIRLFIIALILVALYQLSFTFFTTAQEKKADKFAISMLSSDLEPESPLASIQKDSLRAYYLDSIKNVEVLDLGFVDYTYRELQEKQLSLGLDLKGGISMLVEIDQADLLKKIAIGNQDPAFNVAIDAAVAGQANNQDAFLTSFQKEYEKANPDAQLSGIFAGIEEFREDIDWDSNNDQVMKAVREAVDAKVSETHNVLVTRIDEFGVAQPFISEPDDNGRIYIELPGAQNSDRIMGIIQSAAILEFYKTYTNQDQIGNGEVFGNRLFQANEVLRGLLGLEIISNDDEVVDADVVDIEDAGDAIDDIVDAAIDTSDADDALALLEDDVEDDLGLEDTLQANPLFDILIPNIFQNEATGQQEFGQGPAIGFVLKRHKEKVSSYLAMEEIKNLFPRDVKFAWSAKQRQDADGTTSDYYVLYALQVNASTGEPALTGEGVVDAAAAINEYGNAEVNMAMNTIAANKWYKLTEENVDRSIAIVLDGKVFSAPNVKSPISGGRSNIDGMSDIDEANDLANILKSGKLDAQINIPQQAVVGATMGKTAQRQGKTALAVGLLLVVLFMILYYSGAGLVAVLALVVNLLLILGYLASKGAALTLPGMAGIVLTIGMAVDANVIIFERIREELRKGKGLRLAITEGFSKSYAAIVDANVTTFIAGAVLLALGRGPVQGFAVVLLVGIVASLITAVLLSRIVFDSLLKRNINVPFSTPPTKNILTNTNFDFVGKRKIAYIFSGIIILAGLASIFTKGFDLGVDFKGGRSYVIDFDQNVSTDEVRTDLTSIFGDQVPVVKSYDSDDKVQIITSYMIESDDQKMDSTIKVMMYGGLTKFYVNPPTLEEFTQTETYVEQSNKVDTSIADDIKFTAFGAGIVGAILIFIYLVIRFRKWQFGAGALGAVLHDVLVMLGIFSIFWGILPWSMEIEQKFIAAILTIIGYSINDTVVVFDRIREYFKEHPSRDNKTNINSAINSTLSRTLMTSLTTFLVVLVLFLFGGDSIAGFAFALLVGVLVGTYSSIFIASSILVDTLGDGGKK